MKMFDKFQSMSMDKLVDWLDEYCMFDYAPWMNWFDARYCKNCGSETGNYSWCELNGKCKYFEYMNDIPDNKQIIKMWLESESE